MAFQGSRSAGKDAVLDFYRLREQPFGSAPDSRYTYLGKSYREALASVCLGLGAGHGLQALIAAPGLGKTMVLLHLLEHLKHSARTAFLFHTLCDAPSFFRQIVGQLGGASGERDVVTLLATLRETLAHERRLGRRVVLVVDEAHNLDSAALETLRLLSGCEAPARSSLQIVLAGQPVLAERLLEPALEALTQRLSTIAQIGPLAVAERATYVTHRLRIAGRTDASLVDRDALQLVTAATRGVPRAINTVLHAALNLGYALAAPTIDRRIIEEVLRDRNLERLCLAEIGRLRVLAADRPARTLAHAPRTLSLPTWRRGADGPFEQAASQS